MLYRKLLPLLLFLSVSVFGEDISKGMVPDVTNPIPLGVIPLFSVSPQTLSEDSINVEYSITNTTFEDTLDVEVLNKPKELSPFIVLGEIFGFNGFVWAWDRYVLDKDYARTGPSYWKRNFKEGWEWDHNHWAINFYGHPYQGATYYNFARGAGYGFYASLLFSLLF